MQKIINVYNLGRIEYNKCLKIQKHLVRNMLDNQSNQSYRNDTILFVEHNPVYTIGLRRSDYDERYINSLRSLNAQVELTDRGGLITFHGPGQLVMYPILNLKNFNPSVKWYVSKLESSIIDLCQSNYNLKANRLCNIGYTGVWINDKKIAAIGIHVKKYVTYHGLALNCNVDLKWFRQIVPCGIKDKEVSSLSELLGREITINDPIPKLIQCLENQFDAKLETKNESETKTLLEQFA